MTQNCQIWQNRPSKWAFKGLVFLLLMFGMAQNVFADWTFKNSFYNMHVGANGCSVEHDAGYYVSGFAEYGTTTEPNEKPIIYFLDWNLLDTGSGNTLDINLCVKYATSSGDTKFVKYNTDSEADAFGFYLKDHIWYSYQDFEYYGDYSTSSTRIKQVIPANNSTIATGTATLGASIYVLPAEYDSSYRLRLEYGRDNPTWSGVASALNAWWYATEGTTTDLAITSSGSTTVSTTTTILNIGRYTMTTTILKTWWLFTTTITSTTTSFTVATSSAYDINQDAIITGVNNLVASTTASIMDSCSITQFNLVSCVVGFFFPTSFSRDILPILVDFKDNTLTKWPFGYATRFINIISGSSTTALPTAELNFPTGSDLAGGTPYTIDPAEILSETKALMDDIKTPEGDNIEDVFKPIVLTMMTLLLGYFIIKDIL